ncbi:hypothetical protein LSCM1_02353 [Leishmania martiniquensis]|uniref:Protein artemis n=1 Tax=Leishmania martiniquensis TaxID=1580590 RepID=A0A836H1Q5_9TRYP|nr:hypothetical protein LSCM1_02353 [Leishmania martiniquensis]
MANPGRFAKVSRNAVGAPTFSLCKEGAMREYFKSREVYRSSQGAILVDAFRFVSHGSPRAEKTSRGFRSATPSGDAAGPSQTMHSPIAPVLRQEPAVSSTPRTGRAHTFYFLSHFHCDHYTGITSRWHSETIYCSRPTAALTQSRLGVPAAFVFPMDLGHTYIFSLSTGTFVERVIETPHHSRVQSLLRQLEASSTCSAGAKEGDDVFAVRLIPANHCPGAVMFLFASSLFGTVLHTGDFRFNGSQETWRQLVPTPNRRPTYVPPLLCLIQPGEALRSLTAVTPAMVVPPVPFYEQLIAADEALQEVAQRQLLDVLFLDNTFCAPPYTFPPQWEATQTVIEVLHSLFCRTARAARGALPSIGEGSRRQVRCAVLIGCYTIGKERIALALRDAFPLAKTPEQRDAGDLTMKPQSGIIASQPASWCIHVAPSRYALLSSMKFFEECFQSLKASSLNEGTVTPPSTDSDTLLQSSRKMAQVEDVPVLLPVVLGACNAKGAPCTSVAGALHPKLEGTGASPTSHAARPFAADPNLPEGDRNPPSSEEPAEEMDHLLSVFLVPMSSVGYHSVAALARTNGPAFVEMEDELVVSLDRYDQVLIVEPTGWCKRSAIREVSEKITFLRVAYSEHCAFHELLQFVGFVNPARVVPTVSEESFKKHEALFVERAPRLRSRVSNVQPITRFFPTHPLHRQASSIQAAREVKANVPSSAVRELLFGSSVALVGATSVNETAAADARTVVGLSEVGRKRARAELEVMTAASPLSIEKSVTATSNSTHALELFFEEVLSEEDDCEVVRVVPTVVEISDDD